VALQWRQKSLPATCQKLNEKSFYILLTVLALAYIVIEGEQESIPGISAIPHASNQTVQHAYDNQKSAI
jgi:hypothetical protein